MIRATKARNWRTRARAWIFGFDVMPLLGNGHRPIEDGESYAVYGIWGPGIGIPPGEADRAERYRTRCVEHHLCIEMLEDDWIADLRGAGIGAVLPAPAFWVEPVAKTGSDSYRVFYAMQRGTAFIDALALRNRGKGRARLLLAIKSSVGESKVDALFGLA